MKGTMVTAINATEIDATNYTYGPGTNIADNFMDEVKALVMHKLTTFIGTYWFPILIPVGLIGNTLSFLIMIKPHNRKMSTCNYMAAISINDNIMMLLAIRVIEISKGSPWGCRIISTLVKLHLQNATFQVVAMNIDKFIAIKWPHKAATYSTAKRAKWTAFAIYVCCITYNLPHLYFTRLIDGYCLGYIVGGVYAKIYSWLNFTVDGIIPFGLLFTMNLTIVHKVRRSHKKFGNVQSVKEPEHQHSAGQVKQRLRKSAENQLTVMLLLVTTLFLVLLLPTYVRYLYFNYVSRDTPEKYANAMFFYRLTINLYFTNSGINFFLYCISGRKFRCDLKDLLLCRKNDRSKSMSQTFLSSSTAVTSVSQTT